MFVTVTSSSLMMPQAAYMDLKMPPGPESRESSSKQTSVIL